MCDCECFNLLNGFGSLKERSIFFIPFSFLFFFVDTVALLVLFSSHAVFIGLNLKNDRQHLFVSSVLFPFP